AIDQDYPHTEVIVVDDGSNDESISVIRKFGDRIKPLLKDRGGQCSCLNAAFAVSSGDAVMLLDADDILLPTAASLHARHLADGAVKSCGYMDVVDAEGRSIGRRVPLQMPRSGHYLRDTLRHGLDSVQTSFTSGHAWSRDFLERVLPLPEDDTIGPDGYLTAIDRLFGRLEFVHAPVAQYRRHGRNKGPSRFRFEASYMKDRLERKRHRIRYAEEWMSRLGFEPDTRRLRALGDWRLLLMQHCLWLMGEDEERPSIREIALAPLRTGRYRPWSRIRISASLLLVRLLPARASLHVAGILLGRTQLSRGRRLTDDERSIIPVTR
ncbi:MAG: glycosyltransferase, partial [Gammaproteobacteria bacterium]